MKHTIPDRISVPAQRVRRMAAAVHPDAGNGPPDRTSRDGFHLDSLAVFKERDTLGAMLARQMQMHPGDAEVQAAANLIEMLDTSDRLPAAESNVVHTAVQILLVEKQAPLLCRLAEKLPDHWFCLDIGNSPAYARTVAEIGEHWPQKARVTLQLSTALPGDCVKALHSFLQRPRALAVKVDAAFTPDARAVADALRVRKLDYLGIAGRPLAPELLQALPGVLTDQLYLDVRQPARALLADFSSALVAFIERSGARQLEIGKCAMDGPTSARLLECRNDWQLASVRFSAEVATLLGHGRHTIARLELRAADETPKAALEFLHRMSSPECMQLLQLSHVNMLVAHGPVDLVSWVEAMDRHVSSHHIPKLLDSIDASFFTLETADVEEALASLEQGNRIVQVLSRPSPMSVRGYKPLDDAARNRLAVLTTRNTMALYQKVHAATQALAAARQAWRDRVDTLADMLSPTRPAQHLIDYLPVPDIRRTASGAPLSAEFLASTDLMSKMQILKAAVEDAGTAQAVVTARLLAHPDEMESMMAVLIELRMLARKRPVEEWRKLGSDFRHVWALGDGPPVDNSSFEDVALFERAPVAVPSAVPSPAAGAAQWALIEPGTQQGFRAFGRTLQRGFNDLQAAGGVGAQAQGNAKRREALHLIARFLNPGAAPGPLLVPLDHVTCMHVARELLALGQGKLLGSMLPAGACWGLQPVGPGVAAALAHITPWPAPQSKCALGITPRLSAEVLEPVTRFAKGVPADKLILSLTLTQVQPVAPAYWNALVEMVVSRPGLTLGLQGKGAQTAWSDEWEQFFQRIRGSPIAGVQVANFMDADPHVRSAVSHALIEVMRGSGVGVLELTDCDLVFMKEILTCQAWEAVHIKSSREATYLFKEKVVSAKTLRLKLSIEDHHPLAEAMIAGCKDLERVEVIGAPINVASLARGLERSRSVLSVRFTPAPSPSAGDVRAAYASLKRNPWILDIEVLPPHRNGIALADPVFLANLQRQARMITDRNRLGDSVMSRVGAGRGFGVSPRPSLTGDIGSHIGRYLDLKSARALRLTSKAAYAGSQEAWRMEIDRLADLFASSVSFEVFAASMAARIKAWKLGGAQPTLPNGKEEKDVDLVQEKIRGLQQAGLHSSVVVLVLGRRLARLLPPSVTSNASNASQSPQAAEERDREGWHLHALLQGLARFGVIPAAMWLREGMGVELNSPPSLAVAGVLSHM